MKSMRHYDLMTKIAPEIVDGKKGDLSLKSLPHLKHIIVASMEPNRVRDERAFRGTWSFAELQMARSSAHSGGQIHQLPYIDPDDYLAFFFTSKIFLIAYDL